MRELHPVLCFFKSFEKLLVVSFLLSLYSVGLFFSSLAFLFLLVLPLPDSSKVFEFVGSPFAVRCSCVKRWRVAVVFCVARTVVKVVRVVVVVLKLVSLDGPVGGGRV
ncbi:hypothetical protein BJ508DRAFT_94061 [Ascobolus immersus RN42]|uniref:Transmembrane protein n=1 Tax=Ascobolus immersus RN42 TaxID=1160509 RepID=A0A3N4IMN6_ASCIM|nr:hypothetical protein BJ508DRAFT_94061 [Ascobolus immersus RN42]